MAHEHIQKLTTQNQNIRSSLTFLQDIDNYAVEHTLIKAVMQDPNVTALVDEVSFEERVAFSEMLQAWRQSVGPGQLI